MTPTISLMRGGPITELLPRAVNCWSAKVVATRRSGGAEIYSGFPLMEALVLPNWTLQAWPTPSRSLEYLRILTNKNHPKFEEINGWYRGLQAAQVVKICLVALDAGSRKLMVGWAVYVQHPLAVSTLSHHGFYSLSFQRLWPAAYTYALTIEKLQGLDHVRRLTMPENVYVYECTMQNGNRVLVAFHDDHVGQNHDEPLAEITVNIPVSWPAVRVTKVITKIGETQPIVERVAAPTGLSSISPDRIPGVHRSVRAAEIMIGAGLRLLYQDTVFSGQARISLTTRAGSTPVRRWSRPWNLKENRWWSNPSRCSTVAWKSRMWTGSRTML